MPIASVPNGQTRKPMIVGPLLFFSFVNGNLSTPHKEFPMYLRRKYHMDQKPETWPEPYFKRTVGYLISVTCVLLL